MSVLSMPKWSVLTVSVCCFTGINDNSGNISAAAAAAVQTPKPTGGKRKQQQQKKKRRKRRKDDKFTLNTAQSERQAEQTGQDRELVLFAYRKWQWMCVCLCTVLRTPSTRKMAAFFLFAKTIHPIHNHCTYTNSLRMDSIKSAWCTATAATPAINRENGSANANGSAPPPPPPAPYSLAKNNNTRTEKKKKEKDAEKGKLLWCCRCCWWR